MRFSRASIQDSLTRFFQLNEPASFAPELGELVQATIPLLRGLETTPFGVVGGFGIPVGRLLNTAPAAGEYAINGIQPTQGMCIQLEQIVVTNPNAATMNATLRLCSSGEVAALGLSSTGRLQLLAPVLPWSTAAAVAPPLSSIATWTGSHTAEPASGSTSAFRATLAAGETIIWTPPSPGLILYGVDAFAVSPAYLMAASVADYTLVTNYYGRQWAMPI